MHSVITCATLTSPAYMNSRIAVKCYNFIIIEICCIKLFNFNNLEWNILKNDDGMLGRIFLE